jgi:hypothetical protein
LAPDDRWELQQGEFNNTVKTPTLANTVLEFTTKGAAIVGAGVTFIGTTSLDATQRAFVSDLIRWLDPSSGAGVMGRISDHVAQAVPQIKQAAAITTSRLTIRSATVGGDAVVSVRTR